MPLSIGAVARDSGVKIPTIRFYEQIGLLPEPPRTEGGRRSYGPEDVRRLRFIRHARDLGFEIADIRALLDLAARPAAPCATADAIARRHLSDVQDRIDRLTRLRDELAQMVGCDHRTVRQCRVIEVLADHGQCTTDHGRAD